MKTDTMESRLLKLLKRQWVSPLVALEKVGCLSLSQRVGDLRREGVKVADQWLKLGNGKRVKQYRVTA